MSTIRVTNLRTLDDALNIPLTSIALKSELVAGTIAVTPTGGITETNVQAALAGLDTRVTGRQPVDATLTGIAAVTGSANTLIYGTGTDVFSTTPLTAFARTILDDSDAATARATLGTTSLIQATAQSTTTGASIDFTAIPPLMKRVTVILSGVSTNGASAVQLQLGTSAGVVISGYTGSSDTTNSSGGAASFSFTAGLGLERPGITSATSVRGGIATFTRLSGNLWVGSFTGTISGSTAFGSTSVTLGGELDRVRLTTVNGTDVFDAGSINILYEG